MSGTGGPDGADPIPTHEWVKGPQLVVVVIAIVAVLFFPTHGSRSI